MGKTNSKRKEQHNAKEQSAKSKTGTDSGSGRAKKVLLPEINPISRYNEQVVVPGLTLFDIERKPRSTRKTVCRQPLNTLNTLFQCPVCLGYMKKTFIVMECLHRFCGSCIQKCLRVGKKECPSCRVHIPSRRSLRPDLNYDALIEKIFGDVEHLENMEDKSIETWNRKNNMNNAYTARREIDISYQARLRKMKGNKLLTGSGESPLPSGSLLDYDGSDIIGPNPNGVASAAALSGTSNGNMNLNSFVHASYIENLEESKLVNFILRRHPTEKRMARLHRECIRTSEEITIGQLKRFLGKKLNFEDQLSFVQITTSVGGRFVVMDDEIKLKEVRNEIADYREGVMLKLHYRCLVDAR